MYPSEDAARGVHDPALRQLLADHWALTMAESPVWATRLGDRRFDTALGDPSPAHAELVADALRGLRARAAALELAEPSDRLSRDVLLHELGVADALDRAAKPGQWALSTYENAVTFVNELCENHPVATPADGASLVARYRAVPAWIAAHIEALRTGLASGRVAPAPTTARIAEMLAGQLAAPAAEWPVLAPPGRELGWDSSDEADFRRELETAAREAVGPALARYHAFLVNELLPAARGEDRLGTCFLPDGEAAYAAFVRQHTSLAADPREVHATGLAALDGIHEEMRALGERLFGSRDLAAIFARLREDPALRFTTADEVEAKAREALDRARAAMPRWFGRLPEADCVVRRVPDYQAPYTTIAYYRPPGGVGTGAPGEYMINVHAPTTRPRFEAEALAFHESIPGHHLQIALAMELPALPAFRRNGMQNAYLEGWALYTERLADEMGLYTGDLDRMGMLSFDTWRAARLVVDTGIHALGWDRERAVAFMLASTPLAANNIRNEVDRYVSWPGQALGYKLGQITMRRLRDEAEAALGARFSPARFHDAVLGTGPLPLAVLETEIRAWIAAESRA